MFTIFTCEIVILNILYSPWNLECGSLNQIFLHLFQDEISYEIARFPWTGRRESSLTVGARNSTPLLSKSYLWFPKVGIKDCKPNTINLWVCDGGDLYLQQQETLKTSTGEGQTDFELRTTFIQLENSGKFHPILSDEEFQDYEAWLCCLEVDIAETCASRWEGWGSWLPHFAKSCSMSRYCPSLNL